MSFISVDIIVLVCQPFLKNIFFCLGREHRSRPGRGFVECPSREHTKFVYILLPHTALMWLRHSVFHWFYANMAILHNKTCHKLITPYSWSWHNISWCRKIRSQPLKIDFLSLRWSEASKADITNGGVFWFGLALRHRSDVILNSLYDWFSTPVRVENMSGLRTPHPTRVI